MNKILLKYYLHEIISFNHDHYLEYNVENYSILAYSNPYCTLAPAVLKSDDFNISLAPAVLKSDDFNISLAPAVLKSDDKNSFYQRKLFFISKILDKINKIGDNSYLSQNLLAVMPSGLNWLFYCLHGTNHHTDNTPYTHFVNTKCFPLMVWLILQNKPTGKYAKRLLVKPRVRPHHPLLGFLLKTLLGAFPC